MKKKKEVLFNIKQTLILQTIYWLIFIVIFELISNDASYVLGFGGLILYFLNYFYQKNKIIKKNKFNKKKYTISYIVSWIVIGIIFGALILALLEFEFIGVCPMVNDPYAGDWECFLYGIEYIFFIVFMEAKIFLIAIIEIIIGIINKIIKSR